MLLLPSGAGEEAIIPESKNGHLNIHDRLRIQRGLENKESFESIAPAIGVATSTVSREVQLSRRRSTPKGKRWNLCVHKRDRSRAKVPSRTFRKNS